MASAAQIAAPATIWVPESEPKRGWIDRYLERTKSYSPLRLVVEFCLVGLALQLLVGNALALSPWGASFGQFHQSHKAEMMMPGMWILAILVAPVMETLLLQCIPIKFASLFTSRPAALVVVSAIVFAAMHGNPFHAIAVFPVGLVLGWVYVMKRNGSFGAAFWLTAAVHMLHNVIVVAENCLL